MCYTAGEQLSRCGRNGTVLFCNSVAMLTDSVWSLLRGYSLWYTTFGAGGATGAAAVITLRRW